MTTKEAQAALRAALQDSGDEAWAGRDTLPAAHAEAFDEDIQSVGLLNRGRGCSAGGLTLTEKVARGICTPAEFIEWERLRQ